MRIKGRAYLNSGGPQGQRPISLALDTLKYIPETAYLNACMLAVPKIEVTVQGIPTEIENNLKIRENLTCMTRTTP